MTQDRAIKVWKPTIQTFQRVLDDECPGVKVEIHMVYQITGYPYWVTEGNLQFKSDIMSPNAVQECIFSSALFAAVLSNAKNYPVLDWNKSGKATRIFKGKYKILNCGKFLIRDVCLICYSKYWARDQQGAKVVNFKILSFCLFIVGL